MPPSTAARKIPIALAPRNIPLPSGNRLNACVSRGADTPAAWISNPLEQDDDGTQNEDAIGLEIARSQRAWHGPWSLSVKMGTRAHATSAEVGCQRMETFRRAGRALLCYELDDETPTFGDPRDVANTPQEVVRDSARTGVVRGQLARRVWPRDASSMRRSGRTRGRRHELSGRRRRATARRDRGLPLVLRRQADSEWVTASRAGATRGVRPPDSAGTPRPDRLVRPPSSSSHSSTARGGFGHSSSAHSSGGNS